MILALCIAPIAAPVAASQSTDASYALNYFRAPQTADAGSTITVKVDVTNTGDTVGSGTVDVRLDTDGDGTLESGETLASRDVFLSRNQPETLTFQVSLDGVAAGSYELGAVTGSDSITENIQVTADSNSPPNADAGTDVTVVPGQQASLDASGSSDPDGDSLSYTWSQVSGPSVTLAGADTATPSFDAPNVASSTALEFEVTVDDGEATASDTVTVTVDPQDSGGNDGEARRSLSTPTVPAGGSFNVSLTVEFDQARDKLSIKDGFSGPVSSAFLQAVYVDGEVSRDKVLFPDVSAGGVLIALQDIPADATVEVVYTVEIASDATTGEVVQFTGTDEADVVSGDFEANFGVDSAEVGTPADVGRSLGGTEVSPGGSVTATLEANLSEAYPSLSVQDEFEGPAESVSIDEIKLDGQPASSDRVTFSTSTESGVTVALSNLPAGASIEVVYTVAADGSAEPGDVLRFVGSDGPDVAGPDLEGEFGSDLVTVVESSGPVERFDQDDDGNISTPELNAAIQAWATGDLTTPELNAVIQAWATSG